MYVNRAHYFVPKIAFLFSYIFNPIFIYLIMSGKKSQLGSYRFLLLFFAIFNMTCSLVDLLIPFCVHDHRYAFVVFIADGPFFESSSLGVLLLSLRCGFISGTYGILNVHFIFRYLVIHPARRLYIDEYFLPYGLLLSIGYCSFHIAIWSLIIHNLLYPTLEIREYIRVSFQEVYQGDSMQLNFLGALYQETDIFTKLYSWLAVTLLTGIATYSVILYFVLGFLIMRGLNSNLANSSVRTAKMQRQLFRALTVQTVIPISVSFTPCTLSFYAPAFQIDFPRWVYWLSPAAVSLFPCLDPLAIILFLPILRRRLERHIFCRPAPSNTAKARNRDADAPQPPQL